MGKIYIAGKITGTTDYLERFAKAEDWLNEHGYKGSVINPAKISDGLPPETTTYKDYIQIGLSMLGTCSAIFMLKGWEESLGASLELQYAMTLGYKVLYEEASGNEGTKSEIRRKIRRKKMIEQKLMGIAALLLCVAIVVFALHGQTPEDRGVTPVLLIAPLGFYLLFSKECWLY